MAHDVLGLRLRRCAVLVTQSGADTADRLLGGVDAHTLCSSMTLFAEVSNDDEEFVDVLETYYGGARDSRTFRMLQSDGD